MDLVKLAQKIPGCPPLVREELLVKLGEKVEGPYSVFPAADFAAKRQSADGRSLPQAIAHRGYKAKYPENTIRAFEAAVEAGAHALETDLHLSKDDVVILSHDPDLKRCFGLDKELKDCDWSYLETLRTTQTPHEPLPCLRALLKCFRRVEWRDIWLLLDIKLEDDPEQLMRRLAETIKDVDPGGNLIWKDKIVLGIWTAKFIPLCERFMPGFPVVNIGFSPAYTRQFLAVPNIGFNFFQPSAVSPYGRKLIGQAQRHHRCFYAWTVNDDKNMDWCIRRGMDGVITDNLPRFIEMCGSFDAAKRYKWSLAMIRGLLFFNFWVFVFSTILLKRYGSSVRYRLDTDKNK